MRNKKALILSIVKSLLNLVLIPLYFVPLIKVRAVYPSSDGNHVSRTYHFSIFQNIVRSNSPFVSFFYIALVITSLSLILSIVTLVFSRNKKLNIISILLFLISIVLFIMMYLIGISCSPMY